MQVAQRKKETRHENGWYMALILVIGWLLIISLARDVWQIRSGFGRISEANKRLADEEAKNYALKTKLELVLTDEYKEKIIREKLNMQKEGEVLIVLPKQVSDLDDAVSGTNVVSAEANWMKWWRLIAE